MAKFGDILTTDAFDTGTTTYDPVMCKVTRTTDVSVPNGTEPTIPFGTGNAAEDYKTVAGMHSMSTNTDRLVCTKTGVFVAKAQMYVNAEIGGGAAFLVISVTTTSPSSTVKTQSWLLAGQANGSYLNLERMFVVATDVNTYVTMSVKNQAGVALLLKTTSWLSLRRVAKLLESDL